MARVECWVKLHQAFKPVGLDVFLEELFPLQTVRRAQYRDRPVGQVGHQQSARALVIGGDIAFAGSGA